MRGGWDGASPCTWLCFLGVPLERSGMCYARERMFLLASIAHVMVFDKSVFGGSIFVEAFVQLAVICSGVQ